MQLEVSEETSNFGAHAMRCDAIDTIVEELHKSTIGAHASMKIAGLNIYFGDSYLTRNRVYPTDCFDAGIQRRIHNFVGGCGANGCIFATAAVEVEIEIVKSVSFQLRHIG
jgi:hypothetical protein